METGDKIMICQKFGKRGRELRLLTGLSQEKLALQIGMDRTYLASVEAGMRNISLRNIEKIARGRARRPAPAPV